jgi:hypothetical protein
VPGLTTTVSDLVFDPAVNGMRTGRMTVSLHNGGTSAISDATVVYFFGLDPLVTVTSPSCPPTPDVTLSGRCPVDPVAPGATTQLTFTLTGPDSVLATYKGHPTPLADTESLIQVNVGDQRAIPLPSLGRLVVN